MHGKGKISREEGFLRGPVFVRKRGSESFWGKCLKRIRVSDNASFPKKSSQWEDNGSIYIYRRFYPKQTLYAWQGVDSPGRGFSWGLYLCGQNHTHFSLQISFVYYITKMLYCIFIMRISIYEKNRKCVRIRNSQ